MLIVSPEPAAFTAAWMVAYGAGTLSVAATAEAESIANPVKSAESFDFIVGPLLRVSVCRNSTHCRVVNGYRVATGSRHARTILENDGSRVIDFHPCVGRDFHIVQRDVGDSFFRQPKEGSGVARTCNGKTLNLNVLPNRCGAGHGLA